MHGSHNKFTVRPERDDHTMAERIQDILYEDDTDTWTLYLTRLYQSTCCHWTYIIMAFICLILVTLTLFVGKQFSKHWLFIFFEMVINIFIVLDIAFKMKLVGVKQFFQDWNNCIDFGLGVVIVIVFCIFFYFKKLQYRYYDEVFEEVLIVIWFIWQYKRIITLFKEAANNREEENKLNFSQISEETEQDDNPVVSPDRYRQTQRD